MSVFENCIIIYIIQTEQPTRERYVTNVVVEISQSSRAPSCFVSSRSDNSMNGSRLLCLPFGFFHFLSFLFLL